MSRDPIHYVDWRPDAYIGGTFGQLTLAEHGLYIVVLSSIYSRGGPIPYDLGYLAHACKGAHWRTVKATLDSLIGKGKITISDDGQWLSNGRAERELGLARQRVYNSSRAAQEAGKTHSRRAHGQKISGNFNVPREPSGAQLPTTNYHRSSVPKISTDAARDPAPDQTAPGRAPKPRPTLEQLAKAARARLLKGQT